jgi:hypothetical protein
MKKNEIKIQKDDLLGLYQNRNRPNLIERLNETKFYLVESEFIKEWRAIMKNTKLKDIKIVNKNMLCSHEKLGFNEFTFDSKR